MKTVILSAIRGFGIVQSRLPLINRFVAQGWRVVVVTVKDEYEDKIRQSGAVLESVRLTRGGFNPLVDISVFWRYVQIYRRYKPELIHLFHTKPIILGGLAAYACRYAKVMCTITGLGSAFVDGKPKGAFAQLGYRSALRRSQCVIFQNPEDKSLLLSLRWIPAEKAILVIGSGVDLERYGLKSTTPVDNMAPKVIMAARLVWQKGIREFVQAAEIVKHHYPEVRFLIAGEFELNHPDTIEKQWFSDMINSGRVEFLGYCKNLVQELQSSDICILPSYYNEGVPRVLLEAAACGLPIITTDVAGCRECVIPGQTGLLVPPKDSGALANAIMHLLSNKQILLEMGVAGRHFMEAHMDIRTVMKKYFMEYSRLGLKI